MLVLVALIGPPGRGGPGSLHDGAAWMGIGTGGGRQRRRGWISLAAPGWISLAAPRVDHLGRPVTRTRKAKTPEVDPAKDKALVDAFAQAIQAAAAQMGAA